MISTQEYNEAVKEYTRRIFRFLHKSLRDPEAVNDLVQDCYLKLWQHRDRVDAGKIKPWLFSVAHRALVDHAAARARTVPLQADAHAPPVFQNPHFDARAVLDHVLDQLPPVQRSIVLLRDLEGYDYREIGEILGLTEPQVKVYLFRARQKVKDYIKKPAHVL